MQKHASTFPRNRAIQKGYNEEKANMVVSRLCFERPSVIKVHHRAKHPAWPLRTPTNFAFLIPPRSPILSLQVRLQLSFQPLPRAGFRNKGTKYSQPIWFVLASRGCLVSTKTRRETTSTARYVQKQPRSTVNVKRS